MQSFTLNFGALKQQKSFIIFYIFCGSRQGTSRRVCPCSTISGFQKIWRLRAEIIWRFICSHVWYVGWRPSWSHCSVYMWSLPMVWTSSRHGGWVPKYPKSEPGRNHIAFCDLVSEIMHLDQCIFWGGHLTLQVKVGGQRIHLLIKKCQCHDIRRHYVGQDIYWCSHLWKLQSATGSNSACS